MILRCPNTIKVEKSSFLFSFASSTQRESPIYKFYKWAIYATKPVFWVSEKVRLTLVCSTTGTSWNIEISLIASLDMILSRKRITKALIRLRGCAGWSAPLLFAQPDDRFSRLEAQIITWCRLWGRSGLLSSFFLHY